MKTIKTILFVTCLVCTYTNYAQSNDTIPTPNKNTSQETVTKIIRVKGGNGEEKIIKQEQIITKESQLKLSSEDQDKTDQKAMYTPQEVSIKNANADVPVPLDIGTYSILPDGTGYIITFITKTGQKISKVKPLSNDYYLVHNGEKDNCLGHFDENKNFILEMFDSESNEVITVTYKTK